MVDDGVVVVVVVNVMDVLVNTWVKNNIPVWWWIVNKLGFFIMMKQERTSM